MKTKFKRVYWVDLPNPDVTGDDDSFKNVATFDKRKDAFEYLREHYGMPTRVASFFISWGQA
jgi:hypothetical protein